MSFVIMHTNCPSCDSSDAFSVDEDGHGYCFSCGKYHHNYLEGGEVEDTHDFELEHKPFRGLNQKTVEFYNILTKVVDGKEIERGFIYPNEAVKIENLDALSKKNKYKSKGPINEAGLFGQNLFEPGCLPSITITEGEKDAPSFWQSLGGSTACVSVKSSSTAERDIRQSFNYVNSFDKIVIAFDNDDVGQRAAAKVISLFDPNKIYNLKLQKGKDANEYLQNGMAPQLGIEWTQAKKFANDKFINTKEEIAESLQDSQNEIVATYPCKELNNALRGFVRGEVTVIKGLEGIGKTELLRAIEYHILKENDTTRMGVIHMEEDQSTTIRGIATYEAKYPQYFVEDGISPEDTLEHYKNAVNGNFDRLFIYKISGSDEPDEILASIRSLIVISNVDIILLDNINKMVDSLDESKERQMLVYIASKLKTMAMELRCSIVVISHVNDDGKTLGSRYTAKVADKVVYLQRNITALDEREKNCTYITVEKGRMARRTGRAGIMEFDPYSFTLSEKTEE